MASDRLKTIRRPLTVKSRVWYNSLSVIYLVTQPLWVSWGSGHAKNSGRKCPTLHNFGFTFGLATHFRCVLAHINHYLMPDKFTRHYRVADHGVKNTAINASTQATGEDGNGLWWKAPIEEWRITVGLLLETNRNNQQLHLSSVSW